MIWISSVANKEHKDYTSAVNICYKYRDMIENQGLEHVKQIVG